MASWVTASLPLKELSLLPVLPPRSSGGSSCCTTSYLKPLKTQRMGLCSPCVAQKYSQGRASVIESRKNSVSSSVGVWEDPDDGSPSDYDDDDEEQEAEENDLDFESDWEEDKESSVAIVGEQHTAVKYEDELAKEVEHLLEPEELVILQQNAAPNLEKISTAKWSPLHTLALSGQIHIIDQLLENGVNIDFLDKDGRTALHASILGKREAVISHLLRKGANPHILDKNGVSALHYAVQVGAIQTVKLLIKYNADVNSSDNEGWTPLHVACKVETETLQKSC
ncbi:hypothetical protein RDABS01_034469 [Bienertia sinuspersici]